MKEKRKLSLFLSPVYIFVLCGCNLKNISVISSNDINGNSSDGLSTSQSIEGGGDPATINSEEYNNFWNPGTPKYLDISMSQEAANFMNSHQTNHNDSTYHDYYVPCTLKLTVNGVLETYEEVGIRVKGNMSRANFLVDNHFSLDSLVHFKLSFKQTFDDEEYTTITPLQAFKKTWEDTDARKERKNRTLYGMEKIDIKWNRNNDLSKSKQSYALKTFRDNGVLAGNSSLGQVTLSINHTNEVTTTYEILECIDDIFIQRHFTAEASKGDLYKCTYQNSPANFDPSYTVGNQIGVEKNATGYHPSYDLKTNKKKSTHQSLLNFINIVNDKTSSASAFKTKLEEVLNVDEFLMEEAIAYLCGNYDDFRNNMNNYYLYFTSDTNKAYFIPYDFDRCFGTGCDGKKDYMTNFSAESTKMQCTEQWQSTNLFWRTICKSTDSASGHQNVERVEGYRAKYQANIEKLLNEEKISRTSFANYVNAFPSEYRGNSSASSYGETTFANYLTKKINSIKSNNTTYDIKVS